MIAFRHQLPHLFLTEYDNPEKWKQAQEIYQMAVKLLIIVGIFQISDGFQVTIQGALRGLQDVIYPFYISLFSYWIIGFPISWFLSKHYGTEGIWYGLLTGLSLAAVLLGWRFHLLTKKLREKNPTGSPPDRP
jgi:MATE family multidrug resistance protein